MYADFSNLRGELSFNESLSKYTSWRVGGIAQRFYRPADKEDLAGVFISATRRRAYLMARAG